MRRFIIVSSVAAFLMPALLAAQAPAADKPMTLTGCLRSAPSADPRGSAGKPPIYTLEVMPAETVPPATATSSSSSSSGAAGTRESGAVKPTTYTLVAAEKVGLANHIEHRVEVTGQLQPAAKPGAQGSKPGGAHNTFEVTALKMIASQCVETR
jgi:hypothetical protein